MFFKSTLFRLFGMLALGLGLTAIIVMSSGLDFDDEGKQSTPRATPDRSIDSAVVQDRPESKALKAVQGDKEEVTASALPSMEQILAWKESNDIGDRIKAVLALRDMDTLEAVELLAWFLNDVDDAVAIEAIDALANIGINSDLEEEIFGVLQEKAMDEYYGFRTQAVIAAAMLGLDQRMMLVISEVMQDGSTEALDAATRAMSFIATEDCVPHLKAILGQTDNPGIAKSAANTLMKINTPEATAIVAALLNSETEQDQKLGAWALSRKGGPESAALLKGAIASGRLQDSAMNVVASSPAAADVFGEIFENPEYDHENKAAWLKIIANYTKYGSAKTRNEMAKTVSPLLNSSDSEIVAAAAKAIGEVQASEDQTGALEKALSSDSILVQENALHAYAQYCTPSTYKPLTELYWDDNENIRRTAFFLSSAFLNSSDKPLLEKAAVHEDVFIAKQSKILLNNIIKE